MASENDTRKNKAVTAVILARNEEQNLPFCLATLGWCGEIIVVDMESSDRTAAIAAEYGAKVFPHPLTQAFDEAKEFGVGKASGEWVFLIDADEMVPRPLAEALLAAAADGNADVVEVPFNHYILGTVMRRAGWGYTPQPRFFRKGKVLFNGAIHRYFSKAPGAVTLALPLKDENSLVHFNYIDSAHFVEKLNRYTSAEAENLLAAGEGFSCWRIFRAAAAEFWRRYVTEKGRAEGPRGLSLSLMMAFYRALAYIKLWELREFAGEPVRELYASRRREVLAGWGK